MRSGEGGRLRQGEYSRLLAAPQHARGRLGESGGRPHQGGPAHPPEQDRQRGRRGAGAALCGDCVGGDPSPQKFTMSTHVQCMGLGTASLSSALQGAPILAQVHVALCSTPIGALGPEACFKADGRSDCMQALTSLLQSNMP
jgi:hypothetical protein